MANIKFEECFLKNVDDFISVEDLKKYMTDTMEAIKEIIIIISIAQSVLLHSFRSIRMRRLHILGLKGNTLKDAHLTLHPSVKNK